MIWGAVKRTAISEWTAGALVLLGIYVLSLIIPARTTLIPEWVIVATGAVLALTVYRVLFVRRRP